MNGFISHIINRHLHTERNIKPRVPGRFESFNFIQPNPGEINTLPLEEVETNNYQQTDNNAVSIEKPVITHDNNSFPLKPLKSDKKSKVNLIFPIQDQPESDINIAFPLIENTVAYNNISNSINPNIDKEITAGNISPEHEENLLVSAERNNPPKVVSSLVDHNIVNSFTEEENNNNPNSVQPIQASLIAQKKKNIIVNQRSIFFESAEQKAAPTIKVSIGRIEVRAITSSQAVKKESNTPQKLTMSLDDYLKKRNDKK